MSIRHPFTQSHLAQKILPSLAAVALVGSLGLGAPAEAATGAGNGHDAGSGTATSNIGGDGAGYDTMADYMTAVLNDVDHFWSKAYAGAGLPEPQVRYYFPMPGEKVTTDTCGMTDDTTFEYCVEDDVILASQAMATAIWNGTVRGNHDPNSGRPTGDFSVAYAVAHEYAHNLQEEAGLFQRYPVYKTELHADCLAGIWANSAYFRNILDANDLDELAAIIERIGDYLSEADPRHHGTPQQRYDAFMTGYNSGDTAACQSWLDTAY